MYKKYRYFSNIFRNSKFDLMVVISVILFNVGTYPSFIMSTLNIFSKNLRLTRYWYIAIDTFKICLTIPKSLNKVSPLNSSLF